MHNTIQELQEIINVFTLKFQQITSDDFKAKPHPNKWCKIEVLGHLIDSAHNNYRRFIIGQYEQTPPKIFYDQNFWVQTNHYEHGDKDDLILLWKLMNERICAVLLSMPFEDSQKLCDSGKGEVNLHTIEWLAQDYVKHMKHHINQIIASSFNLTYIS